jgi:hypothetical protein
LPPRRAPRSVVDTIVAALDESGGRLPAWAAVALSEAPWTPPRPSLGARPAASTPAAQDRQAAFALQQQLLAQAASAAAASSSTSASAAPAPVVTAAELALYERFDATDEPLSAAEYDALAEFLDKTRLIARRGEAAAATVNRSHPCTVAPSTPSSPGASAASPTAPVQPVTAKERAFLAALLSVKGVFDRCGVPFFLACGTALGARREGRFIAHDGDIDVGVMYSDLAAAGLGGPAAYAAASDEARSAAREATLLRLLTEFGGSDVACFDVLGTVGAGFQLRLRAQPPHIGIGSAQNPGGGDGGVGGGGALVDVNVYYGPGEGDIPGDAGDPFVWTATHYEAAARRRHGLYRYRWPPAALRGVAAAPPQPPAEVPEAALRAGFLESESEAAASNDSVREGGWAAFYGHAFRVPGVAYLSEYFGPTWRTPREYGYAEAVATGEYRNMIPE